MLYYKFTAFLFTLTIILSGNAYAQACGGGHGPCPVTPDPVTPEGVTPQDQQPSTPLPPVIETEPPQIFDSGNSSFGKPGLPPEEAPPKTVVVPPPPPPNNVIIIDTPIVSTETVTINPPTYAPQGPIVYDRTPVSPEEAEFRNETLGQFNMGQDLYGSNFDILEQAAFLITPEEGEPDGRPIPVLGGGFIPGKPGRTQEQMVEDLLQRAHDGDEQAISQLMTGMMGMGLELINKPPSQLTQTERQFVAFLEQRIQNMRLEVALNTQAQWEEYQQDYWDNEVGSGMSALVAGPPSPRGFDPQVIIDFEEPDSDIVAGISTAAGGLATGGALAAAGTASAIATAAGNAAIVAAANSMETVAVTGSVAASSIAGPIIIGAAAAASAAYQIFRTVEFEEYDQAVQDAVAEAGQPVDLQELANSENGEQAVANAMAMIFLNNAGAVAPNSLIAE